MDNVCSQSCNRVRSQIFFQPGKTYTFNINLLTRIGTLPGNEEISNLYNAERSSSDQEIRISGIADISSYSACELVLKLRNFHLAGIENHAQLAAQLEAEPIHFAYEDGEIVHICTAASTDKQWVLNLKKAIISSLQMTSLNVSKKQKVRFIFYFIFCYDATFTR